MKKIVLWGLIIIIVIISIITGIWLSNDKNQANDFEKSPSNSTKNKKFNEKEQIIINKIVTYIKNKKFLDFKNIKTFEIVDIMDVGYYESKSNIHYLILDYKLECKDGTLACDINLCPSKDSDIFEEIDFFFWIEMDMNNYNIIQKLDGISIDIDSDWVSTSARIE